MAKSKSGGTRAYLRGRIASDVYSIGRDASGKKQQVVRSLAEQVANPQTVAQMRGRMIMSTVMQAVSGMAPIIDHSFDNVPNGQPSISEFIRRNYALVKDDVAAHPATGNNFGLNKYQEKGVKNGAYQIAAGKAVLNELYVALGTGASGTQMTLVFAGEDNTLAGYKAAAFGASNGFLTACGILDGQFVFVRLSIKDGADLSAVVSAENVASLFEIDDPLGLGAEVSWSANTVKLTFGQNWTSGGIIVSIEDKNGGYEHNNAFLTTTAGAEFAADVALPTYPIGSERFLNGGEL